MKAFNKDIVRSIRHSLGRFVAIAAIVALGCGFFAAFYRNDPSRNNPDQGSGPAPGCA